MSTHSPIWESFGELSGAGAGAARRAAARGSSARDDGFAPTSVSEKGAASVQASRGRETPTGSPGEDGATDDPGRGASPGPLSAAIAAAPRRAGGAVPVEDFGHEAVEAAPAADPSKPDPAEEAAALEAKLARARGEGRAAGFEEGVAHAESQGQAELRLVLTDIREQMQDALHARLDMEAADIAAARRLAEALLTGIAPAFAAAGLAAEVAAAAAEVLRAETSRTAPAAPMAIRVAPAQREAVAKALASSGLEVAPIADAALSDLSARIEWAGGEDEINLGAALDAARAALERAVPPVAATPAEAPAAEETAAAPNPERKTANG